MSEPKEKPMGELIQLRDFQNPKDLERMYRERTLEDQANDIMAALMGDAEYFAPAKDSD